MTQLPKALYNVAQTREMDRRAIEELGISGYRLMTRAGKASFRLIQKRWPETRKLLVCCGVGNNGGDGYIVARLALEAGYEALVLRFGDHGHLGSVADQARKAYEEQGGQYVSREAYQKPEAIFAGYQLIVDAVLGIGLDREVAQDWRQIFSVINAVDIPVLSLDIPSGLCADTGKLWGEAIQADATITFIAMKQGLFTAWGPDFSGEIYYADLGLAGETGAVVYQGITPVTRLDKTDIAPVTHARRQNVHKGNYGRVLVIGGGAGCPESADNFPGAGPVMPGALLLAGLSALRVGAGLVTVASCRWNLTSVLAHTPELIGLAIGLDPASCDALRQAISESDVIAIGPGLGSGSWSRKVFSTVCELAVCPVVVDADALSLYSRVIEQGERAFSNSRYSILTPHPGEAARLLGIGTEEVQSDRVGCCRRIRERGGDLVLLKGCGSVIDDESGTAIVDCGSPGMATAGAGDVLTGAIAGLIAQQPSFGVDLCTISRAAIVAHSVAGEEAVIEGCRGTLASDLIPHLRRVVNGNRD